jgi:hypothetical protein
LRPDGFGARQIGGRCRAISGEAPHDRDFAPGEFVRGRGRPHTTDEKADRLQASRSAFTVSAAPNPELRFNISCKQSELKVCS